MVNAGVARYRDLNGRHLAVLGQAQVDAETIDLQAETTQSRVRVAVAARTRVLRDGAVVEADRQLIQQPGFVAQELTIGLEQRRPVTVEKIVALYTSRDRAISECRDDARLAATGAADFAGLLARHEGAWRSSWNRFDVQLDSANEWTETVLHLHIFHLLQTVSPHTVHLDVGVPARGWNGEAYRGHIFWDELFIFPFFNFGRPMLAGTLLEYRHARIATARLEDKSYAVAVHTRRIVDPARWAGPIEEAAGRIAARHGLEVVPGKMVWELRLAVHSDKGDAVGRVVADSGARSVVVAGDDLGDLAAFTTASRLAGEGLRVAVRSAEVPPELLAEADLIVEGPAGLQEFLGRLLA